MNKFSNISKVRIKNYNAIQDITIDFDNPIIALKADNGVGKTSIINAISTLALNDDSKLKSRIRNGEEELEIDVMLEDKTLLQRKKGKKNIAKVIDGNGNVLLDTEKIDVGFPIKEIEDRMGFWSEKETGLVLNKKTYLDPLLFVNTKTSDNYKIFYQALKIDSLLKGLKYGNDDVNAKKKTINEMLVKKKTYLEMKEKISIIETEELEQIQKVLKRDDEIEKLLEYIKERINKQKIDKIELPSLKYFEEAEKCKTLINKIKVIQEEKIEIPKVSKVANYLKMLITIKTLSEASKIPKIYDLENIKALNDKTKGLEKEIKEIKEKVSSIKIICPHCHKDILDCTETVKKE